MQSLFVLNSSGGVLLEKHWRGSVSRSVCDYFWDECKKYSVPEDIPPVVISPKYYLVNVRKDLLWLVMTLQREFPPLLVVEFLNRVCDVMKDYFGELSEEALKDNLLAVFQLLDEMMDCGFPLTTEPNVLKEIIKTPSVRQKAAALMGGNASGASTSVGRHLPSGSQSNIRWRKGNVKYSNNEVFLDVTETVEGTVNKNGVLVSCLVNADVNCNCHLSGMPDLTLTFHNPSLLDDTTFHPCVRYARFEKEKIISFVPPDGQFQLMTYRVKNPTNIQLPLKINSTFTWTSTSGRFTIEAIPKVVPDAAKGVENIVLTIPFPKVSGAVSLHAVQGTIKYDEFTKICKWNVGRLPRSVSLTGTVNLQTGAATPATNPVVLANFKIVQFAASGLKMNRLKVDNAKYRLFKGVRTVTVGGDNLQYRC